MRRLIFNIFKSLSLVYNRHFNLLSWGSKSIQIFHFVLNLIWGCSRCIRICSICVLNVAGAALFRCWTEVEESIILHLCSKPKIMWEIKQPIRKRHWWSELLKDANRAIWTHLEQPQLRFETKWKIWTLFEPKHKNFKCLLKIEVWKFFF
jgi:hypothetical protein